MNHDRKMVEKEIDGNNDDKRQLPKMKGLLIECDREVAKIKILKKYLRERFRRE